MFFDNDPYNNISLIQPQARYVYYQRNVKFTILFCEYIVLFRTTEQIRLLGWNIPADELKQIPEHWLTYQEPEASMHFLLGLIYAAFTVLSLVGNGLVLWIFSS